MRRGRRASVPAATRDVSSPSDTIATMNELIRYHDTRGLDATARTFTDVLIKGIADGGGLFVPDEIPHLSIDDVMSLSGLRYRQRAARIFTAFGIDMPQTRIGELTRAAYGRNFDTFEVAPVVEIQPDTHVLELWHGPTSAFKDMALQCMPLLFSEAIEMRQAAGKATDDYLVLVATSGDTGKAALEGFADRPHTRIAVFYPVDGVSDIQRKQMVTQRGDNVSVFGMHGNFDDCQNAVKAAFNDTTFNAELHERHGTTLSSANSINWGRLLPQVVYYVSAYADMVADGGVKAGEPIDVCVPTGNFGNILGAYYAREMGVPIGRLICASNENNVLTDFIATGTYDISQREFVRTPSPSMDILVSSNLERLLWDLSREGASVLGWMRDLAEKHRFQVDRDTFVRVRDLLSADFVTNDESLATVRRVWNESHYLLDPHTAVAWEVAERQRGDDPILVVATAHWAKFGTDVYKALRGIAYGAPLPAEAASLSGVELLAKLQEMAPSGACIPRPLAELDQAEVRFSQVVDADGRGVEDALRKWLA